MTFLDRYQCEEAGTEEGQPRCLGMIAEEAADNDAGRWMVSYEDGVPFSLAYEKLAVLHHPVLQDHEARIAALEALVESLAS